jgi:hypothetical protein
VPSLFYTQFVLTTDYADGHRFLSFVFSLICANPCHLWFFNFFLYRGGQAPSLGDSY